MKLFKTNLCVLLSSIIITNSFAQIKFANTWFSSGDHSAYQFIEMADSSFYLVGHTSPVWLLTNYFDGYLMHVNKYGDTLWTRTYDSTNFTGIAPFNNASIIISGNIYADPSFAHYSLAQLDVNGDTNWVKQYGYPYFTCATYPGYVNQCPDGGYVTFSNEGCDYGIFKIDSLGSVQWHHSHNMYQAWEIKPDPYGGYIAVGGGGGGLESYEVARLDSVGIEIWHRSYGNNIWGNDFYARDVVVLPDSNYLVGCDGWDWQLMKLDRNTGDTIWTKFTNQTYCMDYAGNDKYICATGYYFTLINENGDTIWQKPKPFFPYNSYYDVHKTLDGGYAFCGDYIRYGPARRLLCFVKLDSLGNTIFTSVYDPENNYQPLLFYPNPVQNELFISTGTFATENKLVFLLYDLQDREILHEAYNKSNPVDLSAVPNGVYVGVLKGKEKEVRGKVVVQRSRE